MLSYTILQHKAYKGGIGRGGATGVDLWRKACYNAVCAHNTVHVIRGHYNEQC